jgi:hypothetical protein
MDKRCVQCGKPRGIFRQTYFFLAHPIWYVLKKNEDSHHNFTNLLEKQNFSYITKTNYHLYVATIHERIFLILQISI